MSRQSMLLAGLGAVLIVALWWLFLYSPGQDELEQIDGEIAAAEQEQLSLQRRVAQLEQVRSRAPETEAAIARLQSVVPLEPALPGALRQISAAADDAGMTLEALAATRPTELEDASELHSVSLTLTASGSYFQLVDFLRRLEDPTITSRGISFNNLSIARGEYPSLTVSLSGAMYAVLEPVPEPVVDAPPPADGEAVEEGADGDTADGDTTDGDTTETTQGDAP